jgi:WD40 repeat protein
MRRSRLIKAVKFSLLLIVSAQLFLYGHAQSQQLGETRPRLVVQTPHNTPIMSLSFSPDGRVLASGSYFNSTIKLWDTASGREIHTLVGHGQAVHAVTFSPNGQTLASGGTDKMIRLWEVDSGRLLHTFSTDSEVFSIAFSPDGHILVSGESGGAIKLWDVMSGREIRTFPGHNGAVRSVTFRPDGRTLASGGDDRMIRIWQAVTGAELRRIETSSRIRVVTFSPNARVLAAPIEQRVPPTEAFPLGRTVITIKRWDSESGDELHALDVGWRFYSTAFIHDGRLLAASNSSNSLSSHGITLWDITASRALSTLESPWNWDGVITFSPNGGIAARGGRDGTIDLWDTQSGRQMHRFSVYNWYGIAGLSPDGQIMASSDGNLIRLLDATSNREFRTLTGHTRPVFGVYFSHDGRTLRSQSDVRPSVVNSHDFQLRWDDRRFREWDVETGRELPSLFEQGNEGAAMRSPDGQVIAGFSSGLASTEWGGSIKLWDATSGRELRTIAAHRGSVRSVAAVHTIAFSPDGRRLASSGADNMIRVWEVDNGRLLHTFNAGSRVSSVVFNPDGQLLASRGDGPARLWDVMNGREVRTINLSTGSSLSSVVFSPDGQLLLTGECDGSNRCSIRLWDVASGLEVSSFNAGSKPVGDLTFSLDGRTLVSGNGRERVIWDVGSGTERGTIIALDRGSFVVFTPDGRFDTNNIESAEGLHWILPNAPRTPLPIDIFMRDYYEPRLLQRLLAGEQMRPVRDLTSLNRTQPQVSIVSITPRPNSPDIVTVTVEVANALSETQRDERGRPLQSGVYDLRLFRDGQLVAYKPNASGEVRTNPTTRRAILSFRDIRLPRRSDMRQVEFSAYAFNADRVKSPTARRSYEIPARLTSRRGRAYIITVGVNAYENAEWDLRFAANDARRIGQTMRERLVASGEYEAVVHVPLISDYRTDDGRRVITEETATKRNFRAVLELLAGRRVASGITRHIPNANELQEARPEDLVLISFSSHGYADPQGNFYFLPYDIGQGSRRQITPELLRRTISSEELSHWLRDVDAGEMVMIVDACHAAATVESGDFKPGPMGSRGLGQLAYDKGMRILAATQTDDVAIESDQLQQGVLSYALVNDGIEAGQADFRPRDGRMTLAEWLGYGVERVPALHDEIRRNAVQVFQPRPRAVAVISGTGRTGRDRAIQQPSLFDFARRRREVFLSTSAPR